MTGGKKAALLLAVLFACGAADMLRYGRIPYYQLLDPMPFQYQYRFVFDEEAARLELPEKVW